MIYGLRYGLWLRYGSLLKVWFMVYDVWFMVLDMVSGLWFMAAAAGEGNKPVAVALEDIWFFSLWFMVYGLWQ